MTYLSIFQQCNFMQYLKIKVTKHTEKKKLSNFEQK
jgi:hypothetical protein